MYLDVYKSMFGHNDTWIMDYKMQITLDNVKQWDVCMLKGFGRGQTDPD